MELGETEADGTSSLEATLTSWLEQDPPINALMDAQVGSVFSPIPGAVLAGEPVWKSDKGFYCWKHADGNNAKGDKDCATGWYVSLCLWTDIRQADHDVLP